MTFFYIHNNDLKKSEIIILLFRNPSIAVNILLIIIFNNV